MKKINVFLLCAALVILAACRSGQTEITATETATESVTVSESETTVATTSAEQAEITTAVATEEMTTTEATTEPETISETAASSAAEETDIEAILSNFDFSGVEYGNDTAGYITLPEGWTYSEENDGSYNVISPDGMSSVSGSYIDGFADNLKIDQTAMMLCLTYSMNAEEEGFDAVNVITLQCADIDGYCTIAADSTGTNGMKIYAAFPDETARNIYTLTMDSSSISTDNVLILSGAVDSYRRKSAS